jgi:hypothetical protein
MGRVGCFGSSGHHKVDITEIYRSSVKTCDTVADLRYISLVDPKKNILFRLQPLTHPEVIQFVFQETSSSYWRNQAPKSSCVLYGATSYNQFFSPVMTKKLDIRHMDEISNRYCSSCNGTIFLKLNDHHRDFEKQPHTVDLNNNVGAT